MGNASSHRDANQRSGDDDTAAAFCSPCGTEYSVQAATLVETLCNGTIFVDNQVHSGEKTSNRGFTTKSAGIMLSNPYSPFFASQPLAASSMKHW